MVRKKLFSGVLLIMMISSIAAVFDFASCSASTLVYVDPLLTEGLSPCQNFTIEVKLQNVTNLYGFEILFQWDPDILGYVDHTATIPVENYPNGVLHGGILWVANTVDETAGTYNLVVSSLGIPPPPSFNGSGIIFNMTFHVEGEGRSLLEIYTSELSDNSSPAQPIPHDVQDGYFTNYEPIPAEVSVSPKSIVNPELGPCENFTVNIELENVYELESFEFWLAYNTTVLDVVDITVNPVFPESSTATFEPEGMAQVAGWDGTSTGYLTLANVTFHVTEYGESLLDLFNITLMDTWNETIPYEEPVDGYFNNMLITKIYVSPELIFDPSLIPGSEQTIDIRMQNVIDMYAYRFNLTYNTEILTCLGAVIKPPNNDTNFFTEMIIDDENGYAWINVTYYSPAVPISLTNDTVITIHFQIQGYGCSHLNLTDTQIQNQLGGSISHEVGNGKICTVVRDVAVISVAVSRNTTYPGGIINITVVAMNLGNLTETFNVTAYYDNFTIATQQAVDIDPNTNTTLVFSWDTTGLEPCNNYTISAEASQVPYETNLINNIYIDGWVKIKMLGDIDGDGDIDIYDITSAAAAYETEEGDPKWLPDADVAPPYGIIDIYDIVTIASRYGQTC
jgi:hypothetical protein